MSKLHTEVLIAGAGIAGATLANILGRNGISSIIVDAANSGKPALHPASDPRALSITLASASLLAYINIWQKLPPARIGFFRKMQVWDEHSHGDIYFDSADICEPVLGYIVEQSLLERSLNEAISFLPDSKVITETCITSITTDKDKVAVELSNGEHIHAKLLVAADGRNSTVRRLAGLGYDSHDYHQLAVACTVTTSLPHEHTARQRFLGSGPLAFLPLADENSCGIVWSTSPAQAQSLLTMPEPEFCHQLQLSIQHRLGEITASGPRTVFKLVRAQAPQYTADRLALVGDAAHCVHPLAGQGANMGLLDVAALAELIVAAKKTNRSIASRNLLRRYERWRKGENQRMLVVLDGLKYLFGHDNNVIRNVRGFGLNAVNSASCIKNLIMKHATGLEGDLPALIRQP